MTSIPRDLFYKNRKLNGIYRDYGTSVLADSVSDITGLQVDRYVMVDMYAFVELIDILGGIDVELEEPLSDSTYRIRNSDGSWSTLEYPAGVHHVNGTEALRIARARHYTPVFSRDYRQQKILMAVKDKLSGMGIGDLGKVGSIIRLGLRYSETDISFREAYGLYRSFAEAEKIKNLSVGTGNILRSTYSNLYLNGLSASEVDEEFDKGAWIVVPIDNDWELIRKFIKENTYE